MYPKIIHYLCNWILKNNNVNDWKLLEIGKITYMTYIL